MKILMITPYLPYPLLSGGQIRTYNLLKNLSKKHKIFLISFIRQEDEIIHIENLKKFCIDVKVFLKRPPWSLTSLMLAAVTFYPLVVCMYFKRKLKKMIKDILSEQHFDLIHAETFYVMPNIPHTYLPIILVEQTIEYLVYQHYTEKVNNIIQKIVMNWDVLKIKFWEKKFWQRATRVVAMSETDKNIMASRVHDLAVDLVPNGVDMLFFKQKNQSANKKNKTILFVGNFRWLQNREAVTVLLKDVWPRIKIQLSEAKLWIVGKNPPAWILKYSSDSVRISSDIADIRQAYQQSDVLLAPIFGPGGTRYKILESMACGLPVITTSTGIDGLNAISGKDALVSDTASGLADLTVKVLTGNSLYKKIVKEGHLLVEKNFSWKVITRKLDKIYEDAANKKRT